MGDLNLDFDFDPTFIQAPEHRPKLVAIEADEIPTIDLSPIFNLATENFPEDLVQQIGNALREWGCFVVVNHGFPLEKRRRMEDAAREFFGQSSEEKRKVMRDVESGVIGYFDTEMTKNVRDWKEGFDFLAVEPCVVPGLQEPKENSELTQWFTHWPKYPLEFKEVCKEYVKEQEKLGNKLMELIAVSLGLPAKTFQHYFKKKTSFVRLNRYPPCSSPELALGVGRHTDPSALTLLAQDDVGGLEMKRKRDGEWIQVKPVPDSYFVNIGDTTQVWSNDIYESIEHRVMLNSTKERYSIPFFLNPSHCTIVEPLKELIDPQNPPKYKPYSWGRYLSNKLCGKFNNLDVESIRISNFKILSD